jgi:hypothetical protein
MEVLIIFLKEGVRYTLKAFLIVVVNILTSFKSIVSHQWKTIPCTLSFIPTWKQVMPFNIVSISPLASEKVFHV